MQEIRNNYQTTCKDHTDMMLYQGTITLVAPWNSQLHPTRKIYKYMFTEKLNSLFVIQLIGIIYIHIIIKCILPWYR